MNLNSQEAKKDEKEKSRDSISLDISLSGANQFGKRHNVKHENTYKQIENCISGKY